MSMRYPAGFISAFYDPLKNPNAPTIGTATAGNAQISVTFTAPSNVGGSPITSYIVTARRTSNGALTSATGASSPVVVTGLVNAEAYTATAVAVNSYGPSVSSAATASVTPVAPPPIGSALGGGFFAGQISTSGNGVATHNLVIGPKSSAESVKEWKTTRTATAGTSSVIDGPTNSANMNNADHPAAQFCEGLTIGGFSDWYMPAQNELEVCYFNLKPTTQSNNTSSGVNPNAVPARASTYTSGTPAQTSASAFQSSGAERFFTGSPYWSSTQDSLPTSRAWYQFFDAGLQFPRYKDNGRYVRAIRRVAV
jgi:hypothetical protein